jgi:hypothetical protein
MPPPPNIGARASGTFWQVSTLRPSGFACQHFGFLFVERLMVRCAWGPQASETLLWSGPPARWLRIVYNFGMILSWKEAH